MASGDSGRIHRSNHDVLHPNEGGALDEATVKQGRVILDRDRARIMSFLPLIFIIGSGIGKFDRLRWSVSVS